MQLDLPRIAHALSQPKIRARLIRDYALDNPPQEADAFLAAWLQAMAQMPKAQPLAPLPTARAVYRAVVHALASNSRSWSSFLRHRERLWRLLGEDPAQAAAAKNDVALHEQVQKCLPGLTSRADTRAIFAWAHILHQQPLWAASLQVELERQQRRAQERQLPPPKPEEQMVTLALHLANQGRATPGLGFALAAEFLRNLGFDGFKPDRHIIRLLQAWAPATVDSCQARAMELLKIVGKRSQEARLMASFALAGLAVTPPSMAASQADNLLWALGAYVFPKRGGNLGEHDYLR